MTRRLSDRDRYLRSILESEVTKTITDAARQFGWLMAHVRDSRLQDVTGLPDWIFVKAGEVVFMELKTEQGRLRPEQEVWLAALRNCPGVTCLLVRPSNLDEGLAVLSRSTQ